MGLRRRASGFVLAAILALGGWQGDAVRTASARSEAGGNIRDAGDSGTPAAGQLRTSEDERAASAPDRPLLDGMSVGQPVYNSRGDRVGRISSFGAKTNGHGVVLIVGGMQGTAERRVLVPLADLEIAGQRLLLKARHREIRNLSDSPR